MEWNCTFNVGAFIFSRFIFDMNNPFEQFSQETLQGWFARVSSSEQWEKDMEDCWECAASEQMDCKTCDLFDSDLDECTANHAEMCPQVIAEFNLDEKHFN
ncbi:MAG TPA: hypothetical protein DEO59_09345 [Balneola sp.]|nr:hypothetical protein [Balneola sp.]